VCIFHLGGKGHYVDMIEKFHIYKKTAINNKLNDIDVMSLNKIFEVTIEKYPAHMPEYTFRTSDPKADKYRDMETYTRNVKFSVRILVLYISLV
jgi:hypothetical protein